MLANVDTSAICGLDAYPVRVEVQAEREGKERFIIVGLGDSAIREAKERVTAAVIHSGFFMPARVLVNLAPAEIRKEGSAFDLPIALAILGATNQIDLRALNGVFVHGELALDGAVRAIKGAVAYTVGAVQEAAGAMLIPSENLAEASLISGINLVGVRTLRQAVEVLRGKANSEPLPAVGGALSRASNGLSDVVGQVAAKRAMLIAAAGGHNLLMIGPPGCGKSMLANRFSQILPNLSRSEILETVRIHSIAGHDIQRILLGERPFRAPHHNVSEAGLIGGGGPPRPGEISLAHNGVLFLDEFPEFSRAALEALRSPLEAGCVRVTRSKGSILFPSKIQLIAAMNPCPCGNLGSQKICSCSTHQVSNYLRKLSGPILDRIDLHVEMESVSLGSIATGRGDSACDEQGQVEAVRELQLARQEVLNSSLGRELFNICRIDNESLSKLGKHAERLGLSARGFTRVLKVARTIADLAKSEVVSSEHVAEALRFRSLERYVPNIQRKNPTKDKTGSPLSL